MDIWLVVLIVVLALLALPSIVGTFLPVKHHASRSMVLRQPQQAVWAVVTDAQSAPTWRSELKQVELLPVQSGRKRFKEVLTHGEMTFEIEEATAPSRYVLRIVTVPRSAFGGRWSYELRPEADGTRITVSEDGEIYSRLFRFMSRFVFGSEATIKQYLRALAKKFGELAELQPGRRA